MLDLTLISLFKKNVRKPSQSSLKNTGTGEGGAEKSVDGLEEHPGVVLTARAGIQTVNSETCALSKIITFCPQYCIRWTHLI